MRYVIVILCLLLTACGKDSTQPGGGLALQKILVLTKTNGFRHESIEAGAAMFTKHAAEWNVTVTTAANTLDFSGNGLDAYDIIVLLNTTGDVFNAEEQTALQTFVRNGGSIMAIHGAADAEYDWPWYGQMLGCQFTNHSTIQEATCKVEYASHTATQKLPAYWTRTDEWYNFKSVSNDNMVLINLDESTYNGGTMGAFHPISWCRDFDGGHVFYTGMGHTTESYSEPLFIEHIKGGLSWLAQF